jgi:hypothetical protein
MGHHARARRTLAESAPAQGADAAAAAAVTAQTPELHGKPDGAPIVLPSGITIDLRQVGTLRVTVSQLQAVEAGIALLPLADQQVVARAGVHVQLLPTTALEQTEAGHDLLGATTIIQEGPANSPWIPTLIRVAVAGGRSGTEATPEVIQHEIGHVVSVERYQDRSEAAAIAYAKRY